MAMTKKQAAAAIREWIQADEEMLHGEIASGFDAFVAQKDEALKVALLALEYPLLSFVQEEVQFRLDNIFEVDVEKQTPGLVNELVEELYDNCDLLNCDAIDTMMEGILSRNGISIEEGENNDEENH